jgi:hypothetical protein
MRLEGATYEQIAKAGAASARRSRRRAPPPTTRSSPRRPHAPGRSCPKA